MLPQLASHKDVSQQHPAGMVPIRGSAQRSSVSHEAMPHMGVLGTMESDGSRLLDAMLNDDGSNAGKLSSGQHPSMSTMHS